MNGEIPCEWKDLSGIITGAVDFTRTVSVARTGDEAMKIIWEMGLQAVEIFTLVVGLLGIILSLLLLFDAQKIQQLGKRFNRYVDIDRKFREVIDRNISSEGLFYSHNILSGICMIVGSAFILVFLFYSLDVQSFLIALFGRGNFNTVTDIIVSAMALVGKLAGIVGILLGSILLFDPDRLKSIEKRLNVWFATEPMLEKLEHSHPGVDAFVYQKPVLCGIIGLTTSILLTYLALGNILK